MKYSTIKKMIERPFRISNNLDMAIDSIDMALQCYCENDIVSDKDEIKRTEKHWKLICDTIYERKIPSSSVALRTPIIKKNFCVYCNRPIPYEGSCEGCGRKEDEALGKI